MSYNASDNKDICDYIYQNYNSSDNGYLIRFLIII